MNRELFDTVVVGAGPVGSYAAQQLASYGFKVAVLEEHERIGEPMQCTGIIGVECFDRFHLSTESVFREVCSARFLSPSRKMIHLQSEKTQAYIVNRTVFDCQLANTAIEKGARIFTSCKANNVVIRSDRVSIFTDDGETFDGRTAIITSGFYSKLPQKLGMGKFRDFMMGAQAEVTISDKTKLDEIEIYLDQDLAPGFFAWLVPTTTQRALVGLFSRNTPRKHLRIFLTQLCDEERIESSEVNVMHGGISLETRGKTYTKRVIVAGDAAGQVKPTTGGGVYYGLICAQFAADVIKRALTEDDFSERLMSNYQKLWRKEIGRELHNGYIARRIYEKLSNNIIDQLFEFSLKKGIDDIINESDNISFDWHSKAFFEIIKQAVPRLCKLKSTCI